MNYLDASEYEQYGLDAATPAAWIGAASSLIDAHCRRPTLGVAQYSERLRIEPGRNSARATYLPLAAVAPAQSPIVTARVRFAPARRGETPEFGCDVSGAFQLTGEWSSLDPAQIGWRPETGEIEFAAHPLGLAFNQADVTYTAGLPQLPPAVKHACVQLVRNALATPALNVRAGVVDQMRLEYFSDSLVDGNVRKLLAPYVAVKLA